MKPKILYTKIPLVLVHTGFFSIPRLKDLFENFFQFETYDSHKSYPKNALFISESWDLTVEESEINSVMQQHAITVRELHNRGKKIVINNLQEANYFEYKFKKPKNEIGHRLWNVNWFWYSESFINKHRNYQSLNRICRNLIPYV